MSKLLKLYMQAKQSPNNFRFDDACWLAEKLGFITKNERGDSHRRYFRKDLGYKGFLNFQSENGKAKNYQVRQLIDIIEEFGLIKGDD